MRKAAGIAIQLILLLAITSLAAESVTSAPTPSRAPHAVDRVIDGDTIVVTMKLDDTSVQERVRIIGIDSPEVGQPGADVATAWLSDLLAGEDVYLDWEKENGKPTRDRYGRLLAYVLRAPDGMDVGFEEVREGLAHAYDTYTHRRQQEYDAAQESARAATRGLWAPPEPPDTRPRLPKPAYDTKLPASAFAWREVGRWTVKADDGLSGSAQTPLFWSERDYRVRWSQAGKRGGATIRFEDPEGHPWDLVNTQATGQEKTRDEKAGNSWSI